LGIAIFCAGQSRGQNAPIVLKSPSPMTVARGGGNKTIDLTNVFSISDARGPIARFDTSLGMIDAELFPEATPLSVANFRAYIKAGHYQNTFIHRAISGFVVQGGGYKIDPALPHIPSLAPVKNEFQRSNLPGTIAMAKLGGDPNSATSEWFFNLADNSANLDAQNGGFTVFAKILGKGFSRAQSIAALQNVNLGGTFTNLPIINYKATTQLTTDNLVAVKSVSEIPLMPTGNATSYLKLSAVSSNANLLKVTLNGSQLRLQSAGNSTGEATVTITATDNDLQKISTILRVFVVNPQAPVVSISALDATASESAGDPATLRISRSGSTTAALVVSLSYSGSAINGTDLITLPATVTIPARKSFVDLTVAPIDDSRLEGVETLLAKVKNTSAQQPGTPSEAEVRIIDNDVPSLTISPLVGTGVEAGAPAKARITRTGSTAAALTVPLILDDTSPVSLGLGNLTSATIPAGKAFTDVSLPFANNSDLTGTRMLWVSIGQTALANIPPAPVEVIIQDNDVPTLTLEAVDSIASEPGTDTARVRIRRAGGTAAPLTVFLTMNGTATPGTDFTAPSVVTIPAGSDNALWNLVVKNDSLKEGQEFLNLGIERTPYYNDNVPAAPLKIVINDND
jgi:cyclophilin family peptidyl-prolyl cis-trans isomerase